MTLRRVQGEDMRGTFSPDPASLARATGDRLSLILSSTKILIMKFDLAPIASGVLAAGNLEVS